MEFSSGRSSTDPDNIAVFSGEAETHRGKWEMALRIQACKKLLLRWCLVKNTRGMELEPQPCKFPRKLLEDLVMEQSATLIE